MTLNAIVGAVDENEFKLVSACTTAKQALDKLVNHHEGTQAVKSSRMDIIKSQFKNLRMDEDETITQFSARVSDLVNRAENLGEPFVDTRVIKKVLRSLPERFHAKVTAIREAKDISELQLDTLIGNLETYELELFEDKKYQPKKKSVAFKIEVEATVPHSDEDRDDDYMSL